MKDGVAKTGKGGGRDERIVSGFFRNSQSLFESEMDDNPYYNIMIDLIVKLYLVFYAIDEYWAKENISKCCIIKDEGIVNDVDDNPTRVQGRQNGLLYNATIIANCILVEIV